MNFDAQLKRVLSVAGADEGLYVLALHSFIESYLRNAVGPYRVYSARTGREMDPSFYDLVDRYMELVLERRSTFADDRRGVIRISKEHSLTNDVRHRFSELSAEEAAAATHNFLAFCSICGIDSDALPRLRESLGLWNEKKAPVDYARQVSSLQFRLELADRERTRFMQETEELERLRNDHGLLVAEHGRLEAEFEQARGKARRSTGRVDELRRELFEKKGEVRTLSERLTRLESTQEVIQYLERLTVYTRTRADYERSVMQLTPEQGSALQMIDDSHDALVKGSAGTGKSLVLLHAFQRDLEQRSSQPSLLAQEPIVYLTYTKTLVKYSEYLAKILEVQGVVGHISTADSFLLSRLREAEPNAAVDYKLSKRLSHDMNQASFLSPAELEAEIEGFLFGHDITRDQYIAQRVPRRGMRQPLSVSQREEIWKIRDRMVEHMRSHRVYSKSYSRRVILDALAASTEALMVDRVFVDEIQDLPPVDLKTLESLSRRGVVLAGDDEQMIYNVGSPLKAIGINIVGRTRILRTNFRNSRPIFALAEEFRKRSAIGQDGDYRELRAFREGPMPELLLADEPELIELLRDRVRLCTERLGYDPENISVIAPTDAMIEKLSGILESDGYATWDIRKGGHDFTDVSHIRLSTMHSSKGLDFPVVMLFVPRIQYFNGLDEEATMSLQSNLLYVSLTRAMDHVCVFTRTDPGNEALQALIEAHGEIARETVSPIGATRPETEAQE